LLHQIHSISPEIFKVVMEVSLIKEIGKWVEGIDDMTICKLMGKGLLCMGHYHKVYKGLHCYGFGCLNSQIFYSGSVSFYTTREA
jgi:hypothetical protein